MSPERNLLLGMAALTVASCATPEKLSFQFQPLDPHRLEQAETVFGIPQNQRIPARFRFIDAFPGYDVAVVQTGGTLNQITSSETDGMRTLVLRTCAADRDVMTDEVTCTGEPGIVITDYGADGIADEFSIQTSSGDVVMTRSITRIDREWNEEGVARIYHGMLDRLDNHARPRV